jgi:hypothetical protein
MLTFRNDGASCTVNASGYGCPEVDVTSSSGQAIWTSRPSPNTGCPATLTSPTVLASNWSQSAQADWTQVDCSSLTGASCSGPQVAPGQYQVIGRDVGGSSRIPQSAPLVVTIS